MAPPIIRSIEFSESKLLCSKLKIAPVVCSPVEKGTVLSESMPEFEANFSLVFVNVIARDDLSNEGVSPNEGAQNERAQVSEGDIKHSPIIVGIF